ncbi:hypothetical protein [Candidatus Enterococcus murrayae]|uniref:Uncharacterized protein n=1 Tax=Candidatus Enterococcus murrayae TaxID=2815321 RepID=A0ABS3HBD8_9ENTE|nr:hypothetical protein [Enterococcus sp. MJM16]MBO0450778.1 hypothetical protein [Enterococcus sp. MJM16]
MKKNKTLYLPIGVIEIAQLIEDGKGEQIFYEAEEGELFNASKSFFSFDDLQEKNYYIRTEDKPVIELGRDIDAV